MLIFWRRRCPMRPMFTISEPGFFIPARHHSLRREIQEEVGVRVTLVEGSGGWEDCQKSDTGYRTFQTAKRAARESSSVNWRGARSGSRGSGRRSSPIDVEALMSVSAKSAEIWRLPASPVVDRHRSVH